MSFDIQGILDSKQALRRKLANRPLAEKLAMLDVLRERALDLRAAAGSMRHPVVREALAKYEAGRDKEERSNR
jgi:hypothetical protein